MRAKRHGWFAGHTMSTSGHSGRRLLRRAAATTAAGELRKFRLVHPVIGNMWGRHSLVIRQVRVRWYYTAFRSGRRTSTRSSNWTQCLPMCWPCVFTSSFCTPRSGGCRGSGPTTTPPVPSFWTTCCTRTFRHHRLSPARCDNRQSRSDHVEHWSLIISSSTLTADCTPNKIWYQFKKKNKIIL